MAFGIGQIGSLDVSNATVTGSLNSKYGAWYAENGDTDASISVGKSGNYKISIQGSGGYNSFGGNLTGIAYFNKGDILTYTEIAGGIGVSYRDCLKKVGGKASILFRNGNPIIGAGGGSYGYEEVRSGFRDVAGRSVTEINNENFSSGAGACAWIYVGDVLYKAPLANTISGCMAVQSTDAQGAAGCNYLDTDVCSLVEMTNNSTSCAVRVEYIAASEEDNPDTFIAMNTNLAKIATALSSTDGAISTTADTVTVVAGKAFEEAVNVSVDTTAGGTENGITVINNNTHDGVVKITGNIENIGLFQQTIGGIVYTIKVIEEPTSTNITAVF